MLRKQEAVIAFVTASCRPDMRWTAPQATASELGGGTLLITRHLIVPLTVASLAIQVAEAKAQGAFPAPLPGVTANDPAFPPVNGAVTAAVIGAPVRSLLLARRLSTAPRSFAHRRLDRREVRRTNA